MVCAMRIKSFGALGIDQGCQVVDANLDEDKYVKLKELKMIRLRRISEKQADEFVPPSEIMQYELIQIYAKQQLSLISYKDGIGRIRDGNVQKKMEEIQNQPDDGIFKIFYFN